MASPGAGEVRLVVELEGHTFTTRGMALGPESVLQRLTEALPKLASAMSSTLSRQLAAEKKDPDQ